MMPDDALIAVLSGLCFAGMLFKIGRQRRLGTTNNSLHYYPVVTRSEKPVWFWIITASDYLIALALGVVSILFVLRALGMSFA